MAFTLINAGATANDPAEDTVRGAFQKVNPILTAANSGAIGGVTLQTRAPLTTDNEAAGYPPGHRWVWGSRAWINTTSDTTAAWFEESLLTSAMQALLALVPTALQPADALPVFDFAESSAAEYLLSGADDLGHRHMTAAAPVVRLPAQADEAWDGDVVIDISSDNAWSLVAATGVTIVSFLGAVYNLPGGPAGNARLIRRGVNLWWLVAANATRVTLPEIRDVGLIETHTGTSWTKPAAALTGDLLIGIRLSTSGTIGMGGSFTQFLDASEHTMKAIGGWRIVQAGDTTYTVPTGSIGMIWMVIKAGTFNVTTPITDASDAQADHNDVVWPALSAANGLIVGFAWSNQNMLPGLPAGAAAMATRTSATPYGRTFSKQTDLPTGSVAHTTNGTAGQVCTRGLFRVAPV